MSSETPAMEQHSYQRKQANVRTTLFQMLMESQKLPPFGAALIMITLFKLATAEIRTKSLYKLGTVIGVGVAGMVLGLITATVAGIIVYRKIQSKPVKTEVPSPTQNAAYEDANIAESSLTISIPFGE
eukprot:scpid104987/ scgid23991/ 